MLLGYGELEYDLAEMLGYALGDSSSGVRTYFRVGSETARIDVADSIIQSAAIKCRIKTQYASAIGSMRSCLNLRNRYAHAHWEADVRPVSTGLFFLDMRKAVKTTTPRYQWFHVDIGILKQQEQYFHYTQKCLAFVSETIRYQSEKRSAPLSHVRWPAYMPLPREYNSLETHFPPWSPSVPPAQPEVRQKKSQRLHRRAEKAERKKKWKPQSKTDG
jgi:hypothetical protein